MPPFYNVHVGEDTYVTLDEATEYIEKYYGRRDPLRIAWEEQEPRDKVILLRRAFQKINSLPYTGRPLNPKQVLPFPRETGNFQNVKYAQTEQAMAFIDTVTQQEFDERMHLRRAGVKSYKIGDLSETFVDGNAAGSNANCFGLSERAYNYLSCWLRGGYNICTSIKCRYGNR